MKKFVFTMAILTISLFGITGCYEPYDDTELKEMINDLTEKVESLELEQDQTPEKQLEEINKKLAELEGKIVTQDDIINLMSMQSILELYVNGIVSNKTYDIDVNYEYDTYLRRILNSSNSTINVAFLDKDSIYVDSYDITNDTLIYSEDYNWYYYYIGSNYSNTYRTYSASISAPYPIKVSRKFCEKDTKRDNLWYECFEIVFDTDAFMEEITELINQLYEE